MGFMSFRVDDQSTDSATLPAVWVRLEEAAGGQVLMTVTVDGPVIGDLRGVFFDLADESLLGTLTATASSYLTEIRQGNDTVRDLGDGSNMNGLLGSDRGFDVGLEIGSAGIGKDDIRSFSVVLGSSLRPLTLADFAHVDFGVRSTSVGTTGGSRNASSKLLETTFTPMDAQADIAHVNEDQTTSGNLLANDCTGLPATDTLSLTGWSGGNLGEAVTLPGTEGATLTVNADGNYTLEAQASDRLSAGESLTFTFTYDALQIAESTASAGDTATFTVTVHGVNDGPDAVNDDAGTIEEGQSVSGNVLTNDTDIDRLDTLTVTGILDGNSQPVLGTVTLASGATVQIAADGSYTYLAGTAFDSLLAGQTATDSFTYQVSDGQGGYDTATVTVRIEGLGASPANQFPTMQQAISNVVLYLDDGNPATSLIKVKITPLNALQLLDVDLLQIPQFLASQGTALAGHTTLVALSIHAGQEYPNEAAQDGTRNGEGVFYLASGDATPIVPVGTRPESGGWTQDWSVDDYPLSSEALTLGLTVELLGAPVQQDYTFTGGW